MSIVHRLRQAGVPQRCLQGPRKPVQHLQDRQAAPGHHECADPLRLRQVPGRAGAAEDHGCAGQGQHDQELPPDPGREQPSERAGGRVREVQHADERC